MSFTWRDVGKYLEHSEVFERTLKENLRECPEQSLERLRRLRLRPIQALAQRELALRRDRKQSTI